MLSPTRPLAFPNLLWFKPLTPLQVPLSPTAQGTHPGFWGGPRLRRLVLCCLLQPRPDQAARLYSHSDLV